jgi:hypothetical protein
MFAALGFPYSRRHCSMSALTFAASLRAWAMVNDSVVV